MKLLVCTEQQAHTGDQTEHISSWDSSTSFCSTRVPILIWSDFKYCHRHNTRDSSRAVVSLWLWECEFPSVRSTPQILCFSYNLYSRNSCGSKILWDNGSLRSNFDEYVIYSSDHVPQLSHLISSTQLREDWTLTVESLIIHIWKFGHWLPEQSKWSGAPTGVNTVPVPEALLQGALKVVTMLSYFKLTLVPIS